MTNHNLKAGSSFFALVLLCVIAGPVAAQETTSSEPSEAANAPAQTVAVDDIADDSEIRKRLTKIFDAATSAGWLTDAEVVIDSGIVTLRGEADTEEHRQWAANVAYRTKDVVAIINELTLDDTVDLRTTHDVIKRSLVSLWTDFLKRSPLLIAALVVVIITSFLAKVIGWSIHRLLNKRGMRSSLKDLVHQLASIGIWIIGLLVATVVAVPGMTPCDRESGPVM